MPDDVAVHEPRAWVVGLEADDGVALAGQHGGVATSRIGKVERGDKGGVEDADALAEEGEVVAVQMHGMRGEELVLDNEVVPAIGLAQGDDILGGGEGAVALGEDLQSWVLGVNGHGVAIQVPAEDGTIIGRGDDVWCANRESRRLGGEEAGITSGLGDVWHKRCKRLILADTGE